VSVASSLQEREEGRDSTVFLAKLPGYRFAAKNGAVPSPSSRSEPTGGRPRAVFCARARRSPYSLDRDESVRSPCHRRRDVVSRRRATPVAALPKGRACARMGRVSRDARSVVVGPCRSAVGRAAPGPGTWDPVGPRQERHVDSIASSLRAFMADHRAMLLADDAELVVDRDASGRSPPSSGRSSFVARSQAFRWLASGTSSIWAMAT
jgi:hypothetical protein